MARDKPGDQPPFGGGNAGKTVYLKARDLGGDAAATIQAALDDPRVSTVVLPAGEFGIGSTITIPSGKTLMGEGKEATTLFALEGFHSTAGIPFPGVMIFANGASDVTVSDLTLDGAKVGLSSTGDIVAKVSGIVMFNTTGFLVQDVHVENVTGYAHWAVGARNYTNPELSVFTSDGKYIDCSTANANVHFEQTTAFGIHILRSVSGDGDGDIPTEAYLHPMIDSTDIVFEDVVVRGTGDGVGASIVALGVGIGTVTFINPDIVTRNNGMTIVGSEAAPVELVQILGGRVESTGNMGIFSSWTTNLNITDAAISGQKIGVFVYDGNLTGTNSSAEAWIDGLHAASYSLVHIGVGAAQWEGPLTSTSVNGPEYYYSGVVEWFYDGAYRDYLGEAIPGTEETSTQLAAAEEPIAVADVEEPAEVEEPVAEGETESALTAEAVTVPSAEMFDPPLPAGDELVESDPNCHGCSTMPWMEGAATLRTSMPCWAAWTAKPRAQWSRRSPVTMRTRAGQRRFPNRSRALDRSEWRGWAATPTLLQRPDRRTPSPGSEDR